jgi:DNA (cytosine-5)-methyltransferase 1
MMVISIPLPHLGKRASLAKIFGRRHFCRSGGLAEGFSNVPGAEDERAFSIALSVEKEASAHETLRLRSFLRQFDGTNPDIYYDFINGKVPEPDWAALYPDQWEAAEQEAWLLELGQEDSARRLDARLDAIRTASDGNVILIGGPPCQAYSLAGRSRNAGKEGYEPSKDDRHFLYQEYIRILDRLNPAAFVMENVKGMLSSSVDGESRIRRISRAGQASDSRAFSRRSARRLASRSASRRRGCTRSKTTSPTG